MTLPLELRRWKVEAPAAWEHLQERAAIRQFCGNQSREEAEREAEAEARRVFASDVRQSRKQERGPALTEPLSPKLPRHDSNMRPGD